jgi:hypothetical protein
MTDRHVDSDLLVSADAEGPNGVTGCVGGEAHRAERGRNKRRDDGD